MNNSADYGGAVFGADETNSGICASESYNILSMTTECFIQLLSVQDYFKEHTNYDNCIVVTLFMDNHTYGSRSDIFGGLYWTGAHLAGFLKSFITKSTL